jgi:membrane protein DedA with SNARE-associated domain/rhodanese-related sulfurtransferase
MERALEVLVQYGDAVVFAAVFGEQIGLPFPAEPFLMAAGALAGLGRLHPLRLLGVATLASLAGDVIWYWLGRAGGTRVLGWLCRISLEPDSCVRKTELMFTDHGARSLLFAKFVPAFSMVAPPLAGIVRMPFHQFVLFTGLGGVMWAGAYLALGWLFSSQLETVSRYADELGRLAVALFGLVFVGYIGFKYVGRRRFLRRLRVARITPAELKAKLDGAEPVIIVDVRDRIDFEKEPSIIPGALHLTIEELDARHREIPRDREIVLYCTCPNEASSGRVALILRKRGIERVRPLSGGFRAWRDHGYPLTQLTPGRVLAPVPGGVYA